MYVVLLPAWCVAVVFNAHYTCTSLPHKIPVRDRSLSRSRRHSPVPHFPVTRGSRVPVSVAILLSPLCLRRTLLLLVSPCLSLTLVCLLYIHAPDTSRLACRNYLPYAMAVQQQHARQHKSNTPGNEYSGGATALDVALQNVRVVCRTWYKEFTSAVVAKRIWRRVCCNRAKTLEPVIVVKKKTPRQTTTVLSKQSTAVHVLFVLLLSRGLRIAS